MKVEHTLAANSGPLDPQAASACSGLPIESEDCHIAA